MPRTLAGFLAALLLAASLSACGDGEGPGIPRPTRTPTQTPSLDVPTPTRTPTRPPTPSESQEPIPEPTEEPTDEPTPEVEPTDEPTDEVEPTDEPTLEVEPTDEPTDEPTLEVEPTDEPTDEPTLEVEPTDEPTEEPTEDTAEDDATDESETTWVWWLLGALILLGAAIGIPLLLRSRRRAAWRAELAEAEGELVWLARDLLPGLRQSTSREQVAGGWAVGAPRVAAAEDRLTVLESDAPDEVGRTRARDLRDASRAARQRLDQLVAPGPQDTWALDLDAVMLDLEAALGPPPASPPA